MKSILLDTHAALWAFQGSSDLSARVMELLNDPAITVFVSPVSAYELALKANLGKLAILPKTFAALAEESDFAMLPVTAEHYERAGKLTLDNRDPWDRVLTAQSIIEDMPLISRDAKISILGAQIVW